MPTQYTIGLDYGTNSVRALLVKVATGREVAAAVWTYSHGTEGVLLGRDPNIARQHPRDYVDGAAITIKQVLTKAKRSVRGFKPEQVIGIGVDTTGSTPLPVDKHGQPLAFQKKYDKEPAAMAWLWKDHTSVAEAAEITALAKKMRPKYLAKCGGTYSSEWFFSKILHCLRTKPKVFSAAHSWIELADFVPAALTGTLSPDKLTVGVCAAGHKAMWNANWGGYPDKAFLAKLDPKLAKLGPAFASACTRSTARSADSPKRGLPKRGSKLTSRLQLVHLTHTSEGSEPGFSQAPWSRLLAPVPAISLWRQPLAS